MIVIVLSAAPAGLRGALTRWLAQVDTGVFVGHLSARVRDQVWELIEKNLGTGRAIMAYSASNEQGLAVRTVGHGITPADFDGMLVMRSRDRAEGAPLYVPGATTPRQEGWSIAGRRRRFRSCAALAIPDSPSDPNSVPSVAD